MPYTKSAQDPLVAERRGIIAIHPWHKLPQCSLFETVPSKVGQVAAVSRLLAVMALVKPSPRELIRILDVMYKEEAAHPIADRGVYYGANALHFYSKHVGKPHGKGPVSLPRPDDMAGWQHLIAHCVAGIPIISAPETSRYIHKMAVGVKPGVQRENQAPQAIATREPCGYMAGI